MITLTKSGNAIVFTFDDNDHYLNDGKIEVPVNSLTLVTDESQMATFKRSSTNDIFISATYAELGMSKSDLESWFKENACGSTGGGGVTSGEVQTMIDESISGKADTSDVQNVATDVATVSGDVNTLSGSVNALTGNVNTLSGDVSTLSGDVANKADTSAVTASINSAVSGKMDTSVFNTYSASTDARISEDEEVTSAALNELNDALDDKADTSAVTASIAAAVSRKQDTLIAGSGITISNNVISCNGGGSTYSAGRGIDITNDIISFNLPISAGTGHKSVKEGIGTIASGIYSHAEGQSTSADGNSSHAEGSGTRASGNFSHAEGYYTEAKNSFEHASGHYNVSKTALTADNQTLFSVGNGTADNARHNAFEIRQNGDIYITSGGTDIKLQDNLGGGGLPESAFTAYTAATDARLAEDEEVTAAALNTLDNKYSTIEITIGDINTILQSI